MPLAHYTHLQFAPSKSASPTSVNANVIGNIAFLKQIFLGSSTNLKGG